MVLALAFLFRLADRKGLRDRAEVLMKKCIERAKELDMPDLLGQTLLAHAKFLAYKKNNTASNNDADITQSIWNDIHSAILGQGIAADTQRRGNIHTALLSTAAAWDMFGSKEIAKVYEMCLMGNTSSEDYLISNCNLAIHVRNFFPSP